MPPSPSRPAPRQFYSRHTSIGIRLACTLLAFAVVAIAAPAQLSLNTAVDLALRSNPRVKGAQDDVRKAADQLSQTRTVYIPSLSAGAGIGQAYGYSEYPPTLFTMTSGSLLYNAAQTSYIRSARAGLKAAQLSLEDTSEQVAEDTAIAYIALGHDQQREKVIGQQTGYANNLVAIVQQRVDAGQDSQIDLTQAKLTAAQIHLASLRAQDDTAYDRERLARLIDLPPASLSADGNFPNTPLDLDSAASAQANGDANSAVASAFASADAKLQQARGDSRFLYRPVVNLFAIYNRYATFTDSFKSINKLYGNNLTANEAAFGVQITLPLFDRTRQARARESSDAAALALRDAQEAQIDALDAQAHLLHGVAELQAQADVATLQQQYAQLQLDAIHLQQQSGNPNGPQMTPKDEQNAHIAERDKYLAVVDAGFQLRQAEIQLLRQQGKLVTWLAAAASSSNSTPPIPPSPQP
jgi:outer membrane protein TolC